MTVREFLTRVQRMLPAGLPKRAMTDWRLLQELFLSTHQALLDAHSWSFLQSWIVVPLPADVTAGTVTVTNGSATVTGSGTGWTSSLAGYHLLVASEVPVRVQSVESATSLTLERPWNGQTLSNVPYRLRLLVLDTGVPQAAAILQVVFKDWALVKRPLAAFDTIDPARTATGNPVAYSTRGHDSQRGILFEVWPMTQGMVRCLILRRPTLPASLDEDVTFPNPYILELGVRRKVYEYAFVETGEERWQGAALALDAQFNRALEDLIEQDRASVAWPQETVPPELGLVAGLDPLTRDILLWERDL